MNNRTKTRTLTGVAIFTALVVVLQLLGSFIKFGPFSISLTLIPIVVGAALFGPSAGAWLGFIFGVTVLLSGDAAPFLVVSVFGTVLTVLVKGALAGLLAGLVYKALKGTNVWVASVCAALVCPVVNTGVFLIGCKLFFMDTIAAWAEALGFESVGSYMIFGLVGGNFLFEVLFNILLSPVIVRLIKIANRDEPDTQ
ncbi:MAG: ECF transporter S component [Oscillospiraceae bacterium]|nr:ECF transporter S component [Oscillospiraceae bacterium]